MDDGRRTRALVDDLKRYLKKAGDDDLRSDVRDLARDLRRAYDSGPGDVRLRALAEAREAAAARRRPASG
jgi:hypothetical protein